MDGRRIERQLKVRTCNHSAWKFMTVGCPVFLLLGDFGWECTQCGKVLQGINPFKEADK